MRSICVPTSNIPSLRFNPTIILKTYLNILWCLEIYFEASESELFNFKTIFYPLKFLKLSNSFQVNFFLFRIINWECVYRRKNEIIKLLMNDITCNGWADLVYLLPVCYFMALSVIYRVII